MKTVRNMATIVVCILAFSCTKIDLTPKGKHNLSESEFIILKGKHHCEQNVLRSVNYSTLNFTVKFDSSCIYTTVDPYNQLDINKLYGFSDNDADHHKFSARIGWRWSDNALRLFGYVYNQEKLTEEQITTIPIGVPVNCSIEVKGSEYVFTVNNVSIKMLRASTTSTATGYKLYPYFGGDEAAPHDIRIIINEN